MELRVSWNHDCCPQTRDLLDKLQSQPMFSFLLLTNNHQHHQLVTPTLGIKVTLHTHVSLIKQTLLYYSNLNRDIPKLKREIMLYKMRRRDDIDNGIYEGGLSGTSPDPHFPILKPYKSGKLTVHCARKLPVILDPFNFVLRSL